MGILIVLNAIVIAVEVQYHGFETGHKQRFPGYSRPAKEVWPGAKGVFFTLETAFGVGFTVEVLLKMVALRQEFLCCCWNWFDTLIIVSWLLSLAANIQVLVNPMILRLARLARLLRMARLTRTFQIFDVLHLLIGSLKASTYVLLWSLTLLVVIMVACALMLNFALEPHVENPAGAKRVEIFQYFGTFTRAFLSMFEVTMGNWVPICRLLNEHVSEWFSLFFLLYRCLVGFAVMNVIRGVFLHETFKVAQSDEEIMIMQKERATRKHVQNMELFFQEADADGDGYIKMEEFKEMVADRRVKLWLAAMEIEMHDVEEVFDLLDDGDGMISMSELVRGFGRIKGTAKCLDMNIVLQAILRIEQKIHAMEFGPEPRTAVFKEYTV